MLAKMSKEVWVRIFPLAIMCLIMFSGMIVYHASYAQLNPTAGSSTTVATPLQDGLGLGDTLATGKQAALYDGVSVSDHHVSPVTALLKDGVAISDTYLRPLAAGLRDALNFGDSLAATLGIPPQSVPEFQGGLLIILIAILFVCMNYIRNRRNNSS